MENLGGHKTAKMMEDMMANMKSPGGSGGNRSKIISIKKEGGGNSPGGRSPHMKRKIKGEGLVKGQEKQERMNNIL